MCPALATHKQPFSIVASSRAIQKPTVVSGTEGASYASGFVDIYLSGSETAALPVAECVYDLERYTTTGVGDGPKETSVIKMLAGKFAKRTYHPYRRNAGIPHTP